MTELGDMFEICRILFGRFTWGDTGTPFPGGPLKTASPAGLKWHETAEIITFKPELFNNRNCLLIFFDHIIIILLLPNRNMPV